MKKRIFQLVAPFILGLTLIYGGEYWDSLSSDSRKAVDLYNEAQVVLAQGDIEEAAILFSQTALLTEDPKLRAAALHNLTTLQWMASLNSYGGLVDGYKEALRSDPTLTESSFNLELLYYLKNTGSDRAPGGDDGGDDGPGGGQGVPGNRL